MIFIELISNYIVLKFKGYKGMVSNIDFKHSFLFLTKVLSWVECKNSMKRIQWKNRKPHPHEAYVPTLVEQIANVITHGIWILPSILATKELFYRSGNEPQTLSALVYGATLIVLFTISTSFHYACFCKNNKQLINVLHRCDRAVIYIFIAGSYFPWLSLMSLPNEGWASTMRWFIWLLATLGIIYQHFYHEKYKNLEIVFYLIIGIGPALPILSEGGITGMRDIQLGGIFYITGVVFFKSDGVIPFAHAIWHLFVALAAGTHYYAILNHLYSQRLDNPEKYQISSGNFFSF